MSSLGGGGMPMLLSSVVGGGGGTMSTGVSSGDAGELSDPRREVCDFGFERDDFRASGVFITGRDAMGGGKTGADNSGGEVGIVVGGGVVVPPPPLLPL